MRDWRKPLGIAAVEHDETSAVVIGGREVLNATVTVKSQGDFERLAQGYVCWQCQEPQEEAFPETCSLCGFPMRAEQARQLEQSFQGERWLGPRESLEDEAAGIPQRLAEKGVLLPDSYYRNKERR